MSRFFLLCPAVLQFLEPQLFQSPHDPVNENNQAWPNFSYGNLAF